MLVAICADKGAPGVTTTALALAATWPRRAILAECDPAGADLPYWHYGIDGPLTLERGIISLAVALTEDPLTDVMRHTQQLRQGVDALVGPAASEQAQAITRNWNSLGMALRAVSDVDVIADCGRVVSEQTPVAPVLQHADLVLMLARTTGAGMSHLRHGLSTVTKILNAGGHDANDRIAVVAIQEPLVNLGKSSAYAEVREVLAKTPGLSHVPLAAVLPADAKGAALLRGIGSGDAAKSKVFGAVRKMAAGIAERHRTIDITDAAIGVRR